MSSFVIDKVSFVRVAGLVAGIRAAANYGPLHRFWMYDYDHGREMDDDGIRARFVRCYELNADSVSKQYGDDPSMYEDNDNYASEFRAYRAYGKRVFSDPVKLLDAIHEFDFFRKSVRYQIEDEADANEVTAWFNFIEAILIGLTDHNHERKSWGRFELANVS